MTREPRGRSASSAWVLAAYLTAGGVAALISSVVADRPPWMVIALGDLAATVVVFGFSRALDNSSVYDPYWSVGPMAIALGLALGAEAGSSLPRRVMVTVLVLAWGVRLTYNWARGWKGLHHEDWRYVDLRRTTGKAYWPVSFLGVHLMPTVLVYAGCLALLPVFAASPARGLGPLDVAAFAVTACAIAIEAIADQQLHAFRRTLPPAGSTLATGLWSRCRHLNYLGEIGFWWGLALFALAADPGAAWAALGALAITAMFLFISIPMIDRRSLARRPGYAAHMERVPALVPRLRGRAPENAADLDR